MRIGGVIGLKHLGNARDLCGSFGSTRAIVARHQRSDRAELARCGNHRERRVIDLGVVVFDQNQSVHRTILLMPGTYAMPRALIFSTSAATSSTFTPAWRTGGSLTLVVVRRGVMSTP